MNDDQILKNAAGNYFVIGEGGEKEKDDVPNISQKDSRRSLAIDALNESIHDNELNGGLPSEKNAYVQDDVNPQRLPKKARTAYFIFTDAKRQEVQQAHPGETAAVHAKILGQMWGNISSQEKRAYHVKAAEEKEILKDIQKLRGSPIPVDRANKLIFPLTRIKKIVRMDPEVKGLSKDAVLLVARAAELFTKRLGADTFQIAQIQNRRKLLPSDVSDACGTGEKYSFLYEDLKDLVGVQLDRKRAGNLPSVKKTQFHAGARPLTSYFTHEAH